jgi:hypothetical protein
MVAEASMKRMSGRLLRPGAVTVVQGSEKGPLGDA